MRASEPMPVIIEAAINGVTEGRTEPAIPRSPAEVTEDAVRCLEAGAAIVHSHHFTSAGLLGMGDRPEGSGEIDPAPYIDAWRPVLELRPDALLYPTIGGGGPGRPIEARFRHHEALAKAGLLRMGILFPNVVTESGGELGSLPPFDEETNYQFDTLRRLRLGPRISITNPDALPSVVAYERAGQMPRGAYHSLYFFGEADRPWESGGQRQLARDPRLAPSIENLEGYLAKLAGSSLPWSVRVMYGDVVGIGLARWGLERGGHVCVGLEDYGGPRQPTNEELVKEVVALAEELGRPVATCKQAAQLLDLALPAAASR